MPETVRIDRQGRADLGMRTRLTKARTPTPPETDGALALKKPRTVVTIKAAPREKPRLKVAAYCRVSTLLSSQEGSIASQRKHYEDEIASHGGWEFAGAYIEAGASGTKAESRPELQRLLSDCRAGKVDLVLTKSVSRFARNTADCLSMVRELTSLGVDVRFEKEGLDTAAMGSEFMLSVLACLAEDESRSVSGNLKWGIRKRFEHGGYKVAVAPYGYRREGEALVIEPGEAEVVRRIFRESLEGMGTRRIAKGLNAGGIPSPRGGEWTQKTVRHILGNPAYIGDALYQKSYRDGDFRQRANHGELDQYLDEGHHDAIISHEDFGKAAVMARLGAEGGGSEDMDARPDHDAKRRKRYGLSGRLTCAKCGRTLYRNVGKSGTATYSCGCRGGRVMEESIRNAFITCLNKLSFSQSLPEGMRVLDAYIARLAAEGRGISKGRAGEIDGELERNRVELETLTAVALAHGFHDREWKEQAMLLMERDRLQAEKAKLLSRPPLAARAAELRALVSGWEPAGSPAAFPEEAFADLVEGAEVRAGETVTFNFACGLSLAEDIREDRYADQDTIRVHD